MHWQRTSADIMTSDAGYRVTRTGPPDRRRYDAWGPDRSAGWSYRDWRDGRAPHWSGAEPREHYPRGHPIPQPSPLLGCCDSASEAKALCEAHRRNGSLPA